MIFSLDSAGFFVFLLITSFVFHSVQRYAWKLATLIGANFLFYASFSIKYLALHLALVATAWAIALPKYKWTKRLSHPGLLATLILLLPLLLYKTGLINWLTGQQTTGEPTSSWTSAVQWIPLGLSFYTFTLIGYVLDTQKGYIVPETNFWKFLAFAGFFPVITAGPIERARSLLKQIRTPFPETDKRTVYEGVFWIIWGLFKKRVIANNIAVLIDPVFARPEAYPRWVSYCAAMLFLIQIFMDFSAYSDIATGAAGLLGIQVAPNFHPAALISFSRNLFWKRWHISLTNWFRNYVYYPFLKGRKSATANYIAIFLIFFLTGIWHGLSIAFILWGLLNALSMILEQKCIKWRKSRLPAWETQKRVQSFYKILGTILTIHTGAFLGLFFRLETMNNFSHFMTVHFNPELFIGWNWARYIAPILLALGIVAWCSRHIDTSDAQAYRWRFTVPQMRYFAIGFIIIILYFGNDVDKLFYYYRF